MQPRRRGASPVVRRALPPAPVQPPNGARMERHAQACARAVQLIAGADALIVAAGAGMSLDSGLPDFRGDAGLWRAYPALQDAGLSFERLASSAMLAQQPEIVWGFFGHRLDLYRKTTPHAGYAVLRALGAARPQGVFVVTSNVDGQFVRAGFAHTQVLELHGSLHNLQCADNCSALLWPADALRPEVDLATCRWTAPLPRCPRCGALARPNVALFSDWGWNEACTANQRMRFRAWRRRCERPLVIEIGAGTTISTVRRFSEGRGAPVIRINPREPGLPAGKPGVSIALPGLAALTALGAQLGVPGPNPPAFE